MGPRAVRAAVHVAGLLRVTHYLPARVSRSTMLEGLVCSVHVVRQCVGVHGERGPPVIRAPRLGVCVRCGIGRVLDAGLRCLGSGGVCVRGL